MRKFLGYSGRSMEFIHFDPDRPDTLIIEEVEDVDPLLAMAHHLADQKPGHEFRHAAIIPDFVLARAMREGWFNDPKAWRKWANDPDNARFRTWAGHL